MMYNTNDDKMAEGMINKEPWKEVEKWNRKERRYCKLAEARWRGMVKKRLRCEKGENDG